LIAALREHWSSTTCSASIPGAAGATLMNQNLPSLLRCAQKARVE
jgi:hypothetical protein